MAPVQGRMELDLDALGTATPEPLAVADEVALLGALRREQVRRRCGAAGPGQGGVQQDASNAAVPTVRATVVLGQRSRSRVQRHVAMERAPAVMRNVLVDRRCAVAHR
jgi:hypothetical protein